MAKEDQAQPEQFKSPAPGARRGESAELAALREQVAALQGQVAALAAGRGSVAAPATGANPEYSAFTLFVEQQAEQIRTEHESRQRHEKLRDWNGKSCQERTQLTADRQFKGPQLFAVSIPRDKVQPAVKIRAHSEAEALGNYQTLCGIRGTEHPIEAVPVGA